MELPPNSTLSVAGGSGTMAALDFSTELLLEEVLRQHKQTKALKLKLDGTL